VSSATSRATSNFHAQSLFQNHVVNRAITNDLGFDRFAEAMAPVLRSILDQQSGKIDGK